MFFFRRDSKIERTAARRLRSPRGSAYLEFALVLPILVMVVSAMVEFTSLWDAKIMANHAAWTCGRIATVRAGERDAKKSSTSLLGKKPANVKQLLDPDTQIDGMYVSTALLMSTCSMGSMHGSSADLAKDWVEKWIGQGMTYLQKLIEEQIKSKITDLVNGLADLFPLDLGDNVISKCVKEIMEKIVANVTKPISDALVKLIESLIPSGAYTGFEDLMNSSRALRQIVYAADRVATYDVITVKERDDQSIPAFSRASVYGGSPLDLPATYDDKATYDEWMVKTYSGWPPNNQSQKMIDVTVKWPFERAWMFPILASEKSSSDPGKVPVAVGRAIFYPQPNIKNANLYSEGAEAFDPGETNSYVKAIEDLKKAYNGFLNIVLLSYKYRLLEETVGPYDSSSDSYSYKGIGRGVTGETTKSDYYALDGLVLWMDRAPDDTKSSSAWRSKSAPADYKKCFEELVEESDETCTFWVGIPFWGGTRKERMKRLECRRYANKEWFFWGDNTHRHLRVKHNTPDDLFAAWKGSFGGQPPWYALMNAGRIDGASAAINGTFTAGNLVMNFSEGEFSSAVSKYAGGAAASYGDWRSFVASAPSFAPNANAMILFSSASAVSRKASETAVLTNVFAAAAKAQDDIRTIERASRDEIAAALGSGGEEADYSSMGFFDYGDEDEEIAKDPSKAVEKMKEKLEALKKTILADVISIDEAEQSARDAYPKLLEQFKAATNARREKLREWAAKTAAALRRAGGPNADAVARALKRELPMKDDFASDVAGLESAATDYSSALQKLYDAEVQLAKDLGLKSSGSKDKEKGDVDPSGDAPDDDDPYRPDESGSGSGSDNDWSGDFWKHPSDGKGWIPESDRKEDI